MGDLKCTQQNTNRQCPGRWSCGLQEQSSLGTVSINPNPGLAPSDVVVAEGVAEVRGSTQTTMSNLPNDGERCTTMHGRSMRLCTAVYFSGRGLCGAVATAPVLAPLALQQPARHEGTVLSPPSPALRTPQTLVFVAVARSRTQRRGCAPPHPPPLRSGNWMCVRDQAPRDTGRTVPSNRQKEKRGAVTCHGRHAAWQTGSARRRGPVHHIPGPAVGMVADRRQRVPSSQVSGPAIGTFGCSSHVPCAIHHTADGQSQWADSDVRHTAYWQNQKRFVSGRDKCQCKTDGLQPRLTYLGTPLACHHRGGRGGGGGGG